MRTLLVSLFFVSLTGCPASIDFDQGHAYPCEYANAQLDDPSCPGGWVCGREGRCHQADAGPWKCSRDAGVGVENVDCFGWACGVESQCVPPVGADYACKSDQDCFESWRCDVGGTCVDSTGEQLPTSQPVDPSLLRARNPILVSGNPTHLAVSPRPEFTAENGRPYALEGVATVEPGGALSLSIVGRGLGEEIIPFGGRVEGQSSVPVAGLVTRVGSLYVLGAGGGLTEYRANGDGGLESASSLPEPFGTRIRISSAHAPVIAVLDPPAGPYSLALSQPDGTLQSLGGSSSPGELWPAPFDLAELVGGADAGTCMIAVDNRRISAANRAADGTLQKWDGGVGEEWRTMLSWSELPTPPDPTVTGDFTVTTQQDDLAAFLFQPANVEGENPQLLVVEAPRGTGVACPLRSQLRTVLGVCDPCPNFDWVKSVRPGRNGGIAGAEVRCVRQSPFAEQTFWVTAAEQNRCSSTPLFDSQGPLAEPRLFPIENANGRAAMLGTARQLWTGPNARLASPLNHDRQTSMIVRVGEGAGQLDLLLSDGFVATDALAPELGLLSAPFLGGVLAPVAPVKNAPSWLLLANGFVVDANRDYQSVASVPPALLRGAPTQAQLLETSRQTHLIVAAADTLYAATTEGEGALAPRLSPFPASPITSMSFTPAKDPELELEGYVVASGRVFHIGVRSEVAWDGTDVPLGRDEALEVWTSADGRSRVGTTRGQVYSLPGRVPLSPPLPEGQTALDYEVVCDTVFAATTQELFAWAPSATGAAPEWTSVTGAILAEALGQPRLHAVGDTLYLTTERGVVVSLQACTP